MAAECVPVGVNPLGPGAPVGLAVDRDAANGEITESQSQFCTFPICLDLHRCESCSIVPLSPSSRASLDRKGLTRRTEISRCTSDGSMQPIGRAEHRTWRYVQ